jgi:hypothetical protein
LRKVHSGLTTSAINKVRMAFRICRIALARTAGAASQVRSKTSGAQACQRT